MGFNAFISGRRLSHCHYAKQLFDWSRNDKGELSQQIKLSNDLSIEDMFEFYRQLKMTGRSGTLGIFAMQQVLSKGPKILRLSNLDFTILEKTDLNIGIADYDQPYPTIVVDFPDSYRDAKKVIDPLAGQQEWILKPPHKEYHNPEFAILVHEKELQAIFATIYMNSGNCYAMVLTEADLTIEEEMIQRTKAGAFEDSLPIVEEEMEAYRELIRVAMNAALFVMEYGKTEIDDNPGHRVRLQRHLKLAQKSNNASAIKNTQHQLKQCPMVFKIAQDIRLHVTQQHETNNHKDVQLKPHWRRGHWRMQRHGPGLTLRKRIKIDAIFINGDLFGGQDGDNEVIIHD